MVRSLWYFALLVALIVAAVRGLSAFPSATLDQSGLGVAVSQSSPSPSDRERTADASVDSDPDDGTDPLVAPALVPFEVVVPPAAQLSRVRVGAVARVPSSHADGLERPPRLRLPAA